MSTYAQPHSETVIATTELDSWPLPEEWVLEGSPTPGGTVISRSDDSRIVRGVWECTPGKFTWSFSYDETLVVVSGRATVELDTGESGRAGTGRAGVLRPWARGHLDGARDTSQGIPRRLARPAAVLVTTEQGVALVTGVDVPAITVSDMTRARALLLRPAGVAPGRVERCRVLLER